MTRNAISVSTDHRISGAWTAHPNSAVRPHFTDRLRNESRQATNGG